MRMKKVIRVARLAAGWIRRILEVQVPMGAVNGLRTH
jgi:hypothetical protein